MLGNGIFIGGDDNKIDYVHWDELVGRRRLLLASVSVGRKINFSK